LDDELYYQTIVLNLELETPPESPDQPTTDWAFDTELYKPILKESVGGGSSGRSRKRSENQPVIC
jgi:hypothetical protein